MYFKFVYHKYLGGVSGRDVRVTLHGAKTVVVSSLKVPGVGANRYSFY